MQEIIELSWEDFSEQYLPELNHLDDNASLDRVMFETYGAELAHARGL